MLESATAHAAKGAGMKTTLYVGKEEAEEVEEEVEEVVEEVELVLGEAEYVPPPHAPLHVHERPRARAFGTGGSQGLRH